MKKQLKRKQWSRNSLLELRQKQLEEQVTDQKSLARVSEVKRNDYFHLDQERTFLFNPENRFKILWDSMMFIVVLSETAIIPAITLFPTENTFTLRQFELCFSCFFLADLLVNLNTSFYESGRLNKSRLKIFTHSFQGTLFFDLLSIIPFAILSDYISPFRYVLSFKLYRVISLYKYIATIELVLTSLSLVKLFYYIKYALSVGIVLHWLACVWLAISFYEFFHEPGSWLGAGRGIAVNYLEAFYYVVTTTTTLGYGDITAVGFNQCLVALAVLIIGVIVFSFNITSVINTVMNSRQKAIEFSEKMINLNVYMKNKNMPTGLEYKLRRYLDYVSQSYNEEIQENEVLAVISDPLRESIFSFTVAGKAIQRCPLFILTYEAKILRKLIKYILKTFFGPSDIVFEAGDMSSEVFFLTAGRVEVCESQTQTVFKILKPNDYFGEIGFFLRIPRTATIRSVQIAECLYLRREDLDLVLKRFPEAAQATRELETRCRDLNFASLGLKCYLCKKKGHIASKCSNVRLSPDRLCIPQKWVSSKAKSKPINPRSYPHSNARRNAKKNRLVKLNLVPDVDEEAEPGSPTNDYHEFLKKLSTLRLDTINEEDSRISESDRSDHSCVSLILDSEENEAWRGGMMSTAGLTYGETLTVTDMV
jgi:CRP-like cAMP-binding protein